MLQLVRRPRLKTKRMDVVKMKKKEQVPHLMDTKTMKNLTKSHLQTRMMRTKVKKKITS